MSIEFISRDYEAFLQELKDHIRNAQTRAALAVNRELVILYWQIGHEILTRQQELGWGAKVVTKLAKDLKIAFPEMKGFSRTNLLYMRSFADAYPDKQFVQQAAGQIPWFHNCTLLDKVKDQRSGFGTFSRPFNRDGVAMFSRSGSKADCISDKEQMS